MEKLLEFLANSLSMDEKSALITGVVSGKLTPDQQKQLITSVLANLPNLDTAGVASEIFGGANQQTQRTILADILKIAVAGGEGYLSGGDAGAGMAAAMELIAILTAPPAATTATPAGTPVAPAA
jgi:hypothetical protein